MNMLGIWVIAIIVFAVIEGITAGLVSIWFVAGSLFALLAAALSAPIWLQIVVFLAASAVALIVTRPLVKRYVYKKKVPTNADRVLEQVGIVTQTIDNIAGTGLVRVGGIDWTARSEDGEIIAEGERVVAQRIEGVKIYVTKEKQPVS